MNKKVISIVVAIAALVVSACGGRVPGGSFVPPGDAPYVVPVLGPDMVVTANLKPHTIGEELPSQGLGAIKSKKWGAVLGGFTQEKYSQSLAFPPGVKLTIRNLSHTTPHTLDVVKEIKGPPAGFPHHPNLSVPARNPGKLEPGYASGPIKPDKGVSVRLVKEGIYLIGCAFHYSEGMHDVLIVKKGAKPGPQATPQPTSRPTSSPTARSSYDP